MDFGRLEMSNKVQKPPNRNHYIPASYQRLFSTSSEEDLWYFDKLQGKLIESRRIPKKFCRKNGLYTLDDLSSQGGAEVTHIEDPILSVIDGKFNNAIKYLRDGGGINDVDIEDLLNFIAFLGLRHPISLGNTKREIEKYLFLQLIEVTKNDPGLTREAKSRGIDLGSISENDIPMHTGSKNASLYYMLLKAESELSAIKSCGLIFLYTDDSHFVLCDYPLLISESGFPGLCSNWEEVRVVIPLCSNICLGLTDREGARRKVKIEYPVVNAINIALYQHAKQWVMGDNKHYLELLKSQVEDLVNWK